MDAAAQSRSAAPRRVPRRYRFALAFLLHAGLLIISAPSGQRNRVVLLLAVGVISAISSTTNLGRLNLSRRCRQETGVGSPAV